MITYGSTTLTSYNTITKIEVYYYKSTSATSLSGGSWSTTKPTWENGKYIWQKIRTTYEGKLENGQYYSESDPVNITGQQGATGTAAYSYKLNASDTSITVSKNGTYSKTSVTFSATSKQGTGTVNAYAGWFKIETTANGTTWTTQYTSSENESSKEYTIPTGILNIRCSLYQAGDTSVLLDIVSVAIIKDGADGALYPNLSPFFSHDLTDVYNAETNPNGYWMENGSYYGWTKKSKFTFTQLEDGWLHVHIDNSSGTSTIRNDCCVPKYNPSIKRATKYTFLAEFRNNQSTGVASGSDFYLVQQSGSVQFWGQNVTTAPSTHLEGIGTTTVSISSVPSDGSYAFSRFTKFSESDGESSHWTTNDKMVTFVFRANTGAVLDYDVRLSVYEGEYWGNYVPYIISDVTDIRNSAEDAHYKIDNMEIGGRNLLLDTADMTSWNKGNGEITINKDEAILVGSSSDWGSRLDTKKLDLSLLDGITKYIYSFEYKTSIDTDFTPVIAGTNQTKDSDLYTRTKYFNWIAPTPVLPTTNGEWRKYTSSVRTMSLEQLLNGSGSGNVNSWYFQFHIRTDNSNIHVRKFKFEKGTKSTDWTPAPEDIENSIKTYAESIQSQVDGMAEIHYGTVVPTLSNAPYTSWEDTETKDMHVDDLYYNTSTGYCYRFTKSGSTYSWSRIKDSDITAAATAAGNAQTTANNANTLAGQKRRIFVSQPTPPYEVGDLWVEGSNGDIKKCKTARATGSYTATDWELASKYTDDTLANEANDKIDNLEIGGRNLAIGSPGEDWYTVNIVDGTNKPISLVSTTISSHSTLLNIPQIPDIKVGDIIQISFDIKFGSNWTATGTGTKGSIIQGNCNNGGSWTNLSLDGGTQKEKLEEIMASSSKEGHINTWFKVTSNLLNGTYTGLTLINIRFDYYSGEVSVKHVMVEKGNKATNWTPSPEDVKYNIQQVQDNLDNLEIGGRNLFKNSKTLTTNWSLNQATVTDGIVTVTPTTNSNRRMYQMPADGYWTSWTLGQEYTVSVDARSDNGASFTFDAYGAGKSSNAIFVTSNWQRYSFTFIATTAGGSSMSFSIVETSSKTIQFKEPKLEYGGKATSWTPAPEDIQADIDTAIAQSVEYIIGTQTATTGAWTGRASTLSELKDGTQIRYWLPYAGNGNATLNLTLKDGTATGAIPVYRQGGSANSSGVVTANRVTTHFPAGTSISMVYGINRVVSAVYNNVTYTGTFTGWFADGAYDSGNTYNRIRMQNVITAVTAITAGRIICGTASGYKNIGAGIQFDLSYPLLYAGSAITAGKTGDNNFLQINSISVTGNGTVQSGAAKKELYLKGTVTGNTFTITSSPFMTTVIPTSTDGFYYIPLGMMYSTTAIYFTSSNRLYAYLDGAFQPVDIAAILRAEEAKKSATNYMSSDNTGIMVADLKNGEQLPANITQGKNVYITAGYGSGDAAVDPGVYIRDGQTDLAMFGETVRIGKDSSTHGYLYEDYHSLQLVDKERYTYFYVSDLRNAEGYVSLIDTFDGDGIKTSFDLFFTANSTDYTVEVSDNSGGTITKAENWFSFSEAPTANSTITVSYNSESYSLKAYTLGKRKSNERVGGMSVAEGLSTIAKGHYSHAEGLQTEANRYCSHTEGFQTIANGHSAHAENYMTHADGWASHAEGGYTFAKGEYCHAEGGGTEAYGANSHAEGRNTLAKGNYSHAQNRQTIAYGSCQTVIGRYNQEDSEANPNDTTQYGKYALIIGNGNNLQQRSNALCVDWDGNVELALDTSAGSGTTDADLYDAITALGWQNDVIV